MNLAVLFVLGLFSSAACAEVSNGSSTAISKGQSPFHADDFVYIPSLHAEVQKHEVTYRQWAILDGHVLPEHRYSPWTEENCADREEIKNKNDKSPAGCISHHDALVFIKRLNSRDPKYKYRLPNREEQLHLIDLTLKEFKKSFPEPKDKYRVLDYAWLEENSGDEPHEVCSRNPLLGLCDILGNLAEATGQLGYGNFSSQGGTWGLKVRDVFDLTTPIYYFVPDYHREASSGLRLLRTLKPQNGSLKISCEEMEKNHSLTAIFDSRAPIFSATVSMDSKKPVEEQFITSSKICGVTMDVLNDCKGEVEDVGDNTNFFFRCNNGVKTEMVISKDRLTYNCSVPGISNSVENFYITGCRVTN